MSVVERALNKLRGAGAAAYNSAATAGAAEAIGALHEGDAAATGRRVAINRDALRAAGYLPDAAQDRRFADEYRQIKRPILATAFAPEAASLRPSPRLVMMTSALPGDGKTFTSINLALSLSRERDSSVVLVDADVAKPHISRIFGIENEPGLLDALADPTLDPVSLVLPTDVRGLAVLPAGPAREGATELLASQRMDDVTVRILARHPQCIALLDSPPLAISSESRTLLGAVGQTILVVRAGHTPRSAVLEALECIGTQRRASIVLNQGHRSFLESYGYSYGDYGRGESGG